MPDTKSSALGAFALPLADGDLFVGVDVSDTTMAASGTTKVVSWANLKEAVQDVLGAAIAAGANIDATYSDAAGAVTIAVTGLTSAEISDFDEAARDALGTALTAGSNITLTVDDGADTITIAVSGLALSDISDAGTAAALDVPASGDAASGEVVKGNDSRLTDSRTPTSHTHTESEITDLGTYADATPDENEQTGTSYTLVLGDADGVVNCNNASAFTLTVPPNSSVAFPVGSVVTVYQGGAGSVTITPGTGVTIRSEGAALTMAGQYGLATLWKRAADEWVAGGNLV